MDLNRIPPVLLQTFLTVAEAGQISEAARRLHLSQPTVTGHIRRLEASLETTLFIRSANGVSLTERGAHLRERVQDVFAELKGIWRELDRTREVLVLLEIEGGSYKQLAFALNVSAATVMSRLSQARRRLRQPATPQINT